MAKNKIFCAQCHRPYLEKEVVGKNGIPDQDRPWPEVKPAQRLRRNTFWRNGNELDAVAALAAGYDPYCPEGHLQVEALFDALGERYATIGVVGNVSSSKSCFIAALFAEVARQGVLGPLGLTASTFQSQDEMIDAVIRQIYLDHKLPDFTKPDDPSTGLVLRLQWPSGNRINLVFYDVAGEVITNMRAVADKARYVYSAAAYIMLLDPDGFPGDGSFLDTVGGNQLVSAKEVVGIADGFEQVRGQRPTSVALPLLLTVAKADKVDWTDGVWPPPSSLINSTAEALTEYFAACSEGIERHLLEAGLANVVNAARARFGSRNVGFSRASALGHAPESSTGPYFPQGCWQVVLQLLFALGMTTELSTAS